MLLHCSVAGLTFLAISRVIICLAKFSPWFWAFRPVLIRFADVPYFGTFAGSVPLAFLAAWLWNLSSGQEDSRINEIEKTGDYFLLLMQEAVRTGRMISVTFDTRKWYVGYVAEIPNLKPSEKYFRMLPILSGYTDKDSLVTRRTRSYQDIDGSVPSDFVITLPLKDVKSANLFDPEFYNDFFADHALEQPES